MGTILITDGENRSTLAATRSLGRRGCRVLVSAAKARSLASCSRFCERGFAVPDPNRSGAEEYTAAIRDIVIQEKVDAIFPMTEASIHHLNQTRSLLPPDLVLACADAQKMEAVSNKFEVFRLAEKLDVPTPRTLYLSSPSDLAGVIGDIHEYPVVVKPALSKIPQAGGGFLGGGIRYAGTRNELQDLYETSPALQYPSIIQERIVGPGTGLFTLYDVDRHLALFSHRRLREKPPSGGVSVVSESVSLDEEMVDAAGKLLSAVGWQGVAMVEFKRDVRDGKAKLMEINGRFWGTLQLAVASGVDFPGLYLDFLFGGKPSHAFRNYRIGRRMKWFLGTLDHLLIRLKNSDLSLNLTPEFPSKWGSVVEFLKISENNTSFDVIDRKDMAPFVWEMQNYIRHTLRGNKTE